MFNRFISGLSGKIALAVISLISFLTIFNISRVDAFIFWWWYNDTIEE